MTFPHINGAGPRGPLLMPAGFAAETPPSEAPASLLFGRLSRSLDAEDERFGHIEMLNAHATQAYPAARGDNCAFRWARLAAGYRGPVDVVVHFHGHTARNGMRLRDMLQNSGLAIARLCGSRPALGLVPHGLAHPYDRVARGHDGVERVVPKDSFSFPAVNTHEKLIAFVEAALRACEALARLPSGALTRGRLLLTAHSGGGAALDALLPSLSENPATVNGLHFFDATYNNRPDSRRAWLNRLGRWLDAVLAQDAAALGATGDAARRRALMQSTGSGLRMVFINGGPTDGAARDADAMVASRLATLAPDAGVRAVLRAHYRGQRIDDANRLHHNAIPNGVGPGLLADPGADLAGLARDLPPRPPQAHALDAPTLNIPPRPANAVTGSAFIASLGSTRGEERERRILAELRSGNVPSFLRQLATISLAAADSRRNNHSISYAVTPDYLAIGSDADYVRIPMDPVTAQAVADAFGAMLPTARMVDQIYAAAPVHLPPETRNYWRDAPREQSGSPAYLEHSQALDRHLAAAGGPGRLVAGHKKDVTIAPSYIVRRRDGTSHPALSFYGWFLNGKPIQANGPAGNPTRGVSVLAHEPSYADYSHGVRLIAPNVTVDGQSRTIADVLNDAELCALLSGEGRIAQPRFTLDRGGRAAAQGAQVQSLGADAGLGAAALGYGGTWDGRIRAAIEGLWQRYRALPINFNGRTLPVTVPYLMNVPNLTRSDQCPTPPAGVTQARLCAALRNREQAPPAVRTLIAHAPASARIGKGSPDEIGVLLQALVDGGHAGAAPSSQSLRELLIRYGVGVDCSGFVTRALNQALADAGATQRLDPVNVGTGGLRPGASGFSRVARPVDLCPGDTMNLSGHVRVVVSAERRGERVHVQTLESRPGRGTIASPGMEGPATAFWRLAPDAAATGGAFAGYRLETAALADAPDGAWTASPAAADSFARCDALAAALAGHGARPTALGAFAGALDALGDPAVTRLIGAKLAEFTGISVRLPGGGALAVPTPYVINKPTSPSMRRAVANRPRLLANAALSRVWNALPGRAKVGKSHPEDIGALLQGAVDAGAAPNPADKTTLKAFLSDLGAGVDCSGFVSQALTALLAARGQSRAIDLSSSQLRGGPGHNGAAFDVVGRPADLRPGDTMWKEGHIRIVSSVASEGAGIVFQTAESSSIALVGPTAKSWRCPNANRFAGMEVLRKSGWGPNTETNVFSRLKALATAPAVVHGLEAPSLSQAELDQLNATTFANAAEINAFFARQHGSGFAEWFNARLGGHAPFLRQGPHPYPMNMPVAAPALTRFNDFWNGLSAAYGRSRVTLPEFAALMCIVLNETDGDMIGHIERSGWRRADPARHISGRPGGRTDARGAHPGIAYFFDRIDLNHPHPPQRWKASYNHLSGGMTAGELLNDPDFIAAHGGKPGGAQFAHRGDDWNRVWRGDQFPQALQPVDDDPVVNGFLMECDFYKFRGRGLIQTTGRGAYISLIRWIQGYRGADPVLQARARAWAGRDPAAVATTSATAEWDDLFQRGEMLAAGIARHAGTDPRQDYRPLSRSTDTMGWLPSPSTPHAPVGSLAFMGQRISGSPAYGQGVFRDRVLALLGSALRG